MDKMKKPDPSANEAMMPKGMAEEARKMLEQGKREKKPAKIADYDMDGMKKGGKVKKYAGGGSASKRADGCATKGKTRGKFV